MYMGFMKQGVSIMGLFFCNHSSCGNSEYRTAYDRTSDHMVLQFFNVHNMYSLSDEEFYALEDDYIFHLDRILPINQWSKQQK